MDIQRIDLSEWEAALPADGFEVFHTPEALAVLDRHAAGDLHLVAGYNGDRPVGMVPLLVEERAVGKTVLSPPPAMGVHRLGPLLMPASPKRRKREKLNREFTSEVLDRFDVDESLTLLRAICPPDYADPRPWTWSGIDVTTAFTYDLETEGRSSDELLSSFSKSLRREIRDAKDLDVTVGVEDDADAAMEIHEDTRNRYREQDETYSLGRKYVRDLTDALREVDRCRSYVARAPDGEFITGINVLYSNDRAYFWQGGTKSIYEGVSVNSLLHWRILEDIIDDPPRESVTKYDLMGANTERLCEYKAKFGADLVPYYVVESGGTHMTFAKKAYRAMKALP